MKAIIQNGYGKNVLSLQEVAIPVPSPGEVLVRTMASSINDWEVALTLGDQLVIRLMNGLKEPRTKIPGTDIAGIVEKIGSNVTGFSPGDRVYGDLSESGFGAFAEFATAKATALSHMPEGMSFEQAAALPHASMLAWQGLKMMGIREGQEILINGAGGGVGSQLIQMIPKSVNVSGVDHTSKMDQMKSWGYHHVLDYTKVNFTRMGKQYDAILDVKTLQGPWDYARALKPGGCYVTVGGSVPTLLRLITAAPLVKLIKNRRLKILSLKPNKDMIQVSRLFTEGKLIPVIEGPYPLDKIPELVHYFAAGRHRGKVVIKIEST